MDENKNAGYEYNDSVATVETTMKKARFQILTLILGIVVAVISVIGFQYIEKTKNIDYIDGNILRIAQSATPTTGNIWKNDSFIGQLTWASLFETDAGFSEVNPCLAESIQVSSDGLTYTIVLKDGLKWSDGTALTVDDVKFSIESFMLCNAASALNLMLSGAFNIIVGAEEWVEHGVESWENGGTHSLEGLSVDGNTIYIELTTPYSSFPMAMTQFVPLPKHALEDINPSTLMDGLEFFADPVSSGMFEVEKINVDGGLELVHNPHYYDTHSEIERVILYKDYQTMHIDYYTTSNYTEMVSYRNIAGYQEFDVDVLGYRYFVVNVAAGYEQPEMVPELDENGEEVIDSDGNPVLVQVEVEYGEDREENYPMQSLALRQAISLAIDRETFLKEVYFNSGRCDFAQTGSEEYQSFIQTYDTNRAKQLLAESGYDLERPLTIAHYHTDDNTYAFLSRVQVALEEIGFTVIVKRVSGNVMMYDTREFDLFLKAYPTNTPKDWYIELLSTSGNVFKLVGMEDFEGYDDLMKDLEAATTPEEYERAFSALQEIDAETMLKIPLWTLNDAVYINANRISVPDDMEFGNIRYRSDLRLDEWTVKKG